MVLNAHGNHRAYRGPCAVDRTLISKYFVTSPLLLLFLIPSLAVDVVNGRVHKTDSDGSCSERVHKTDTGGESANCGVPLPFLSEHLPDVGTDRGGNRPQRGVAGDLHPHHQQPEGHYLRVLQVTAQHNVSTSMAKHVYNVLLCNPDFFCDCDLC